MLQKVLGCEGRGVYRCGIEESIHHLDDVKRCWTGRTGLDWRDVDVDVRGDGRGDSARTVPRLRKGGLELRLAVFVSDTFSSPTFANRLMHKILAVEHSHHKD